MTQLPYVPATQTVEVRKSMLYNCILLIFSFLFGLCHTFYTSLILCSCMHLLYCVDCNFMYSTNVVCKKLHTKLAYCHLIWKCFYFTCSKCTWIACPYACFMMDQVQNVTFFCRCLSLFGFFWIRVILFQFLPSWVREQVGWLQRSFIHCMWLEVY